MKLRNHLVSALVATCFVGAAGSVQAVCTNGNVVGAMPGIDDVSAILQCNGTRTSPPANPNAAVCDGLCSGAGILDCGDLNADGAITTADAVLMLNEVVAPGKNVVPICSSTGPTVPCGSVIDGNIDSNRVLSNCEYFVRGTVFVEQGVVLTVRPGAVVKGVQGSSTPSVLVFRAGDCTDGNPISARINAAGTPTQPILFTSDQPVGSRSAGDWAGLAFNGCSRVNVPGGIGSAEGLVGVSFGGGTNCTTDGGTALCGDSSGLLRYARIEFGGNEIGPDNELNVLTQNALGSNTKFNYIQAHMGLDDGFEWFGGTIQQKYLVATAHRDDNFDWQLGSDVKVQYGISAQFLGNLDSQGNNGFEGDNNENGFDNLSISQPQVCNMTMVGSKGQGTHPSGGSWYGVFLRRGTAAQFAKSIVASYQTAGLQARDPQTTQHACVGSCLVGGIPRTNANASATCDAPFTLVDSVATNKVCATGASAGLACVTDGDCGGSHCRDHQNLVIRNSLFYNNGSTGLLHAQTRTGSNSTAAECNSVEWFDLLVAGGLGMTRNTVFPDVATDPGLGAGASWPPTSFVPTNTAVVADDPMMSGFDCGAGFNAFFDTTDYIGAVDPAGSDWTQTPGGWIGYVTQ